jgi:hypothetical protein
MLATQSLAGHLTSFCLAQDGPDRRFSTSTGLRCLLLVPLDLFSDKQWPGYLASGHSGAHPRVDAKENVIFSSGAVPRYSVVHRRALAL